MSRQKTIAATIKDRCEEPTVIHERWKKRWTTSAPAVLPEAPKYETTMKPIRAFIQYAQGTSEYQTRVREVADRLRRDGIESMIDQYLPDYRHWRAGWAVAG